MKIIQNPKIYQLIHVLLAKQTNDSDIKQVFHIHNEISEN